MTQADAKILSTPWGGAIAGTEVLYVEFTMTQALIDRYANVSTDRNPIHVDPAYAASSPLGTTIAHGLFTMSLVGRLLDHWSDGRLSTGGEMEVKFVGPVPVGSKVSIRGTAILAKSVKDQDMVWVDVCCAVNEKPVLIGAVAIPKLDDEEEV